MKIERMNRCKVPMTPTEGLVLWSGHRQQLHECIVQVLCIECLRLQTRSLGIVADHFKGVIASSDNTLAPITYLTMKQYQIEIEDGHPIASFHDYKDGYVFKVTSPWLIVARHAGMVYATHAMRLTKEMARRDLDIDRLPAPMPTTVNVLKEREQMKDVIDSNEVKAKDQWIMYHLLMDERYLNFFGPEKWRSPRPPPRSYDHNIERDTIL